MGDNHNLPEALTAIINIFSRLPRYVEYQKKEKTPRLT